MTKKPKAGKAAKEKKTKVVPAPAAGIGHNSNGKKIPAVCKMLDELLDIAKRKKELGKAERDIRNRAKTEFGILSGPLAHELRLRKMDDDVRVQFESNHEDLKTALGYQPSLDFAGAQPTKASLKAQPTEAELAARNNGDEGFEVNGDEEQQPEDDMKPPAFLRRQQAQQEEAPANEDVIEREG